MSMCACEQYPCEHTGGVVWADQASETGWRWCPVCHHEFPHHFEDCPAPTEPTFRRESLETAWDEGYAAAFHDTGYGDTKNPTQPKENDHA